MRAPRCRTTATSGFLREEAGLAVVVIGDEDDHSPDDVDTYVRFLRERKGLNQPQRVSLYAIAPTDNTCSVRRRHRHPLRRGREGHRR